MGIKVSKLFLPVHTWNQACHRAGHRRKKKKNVRLVKLESFKKKKDLWVAEMFV